MARTLLQLVQAAASEMGLTPAPQTVFGNPDPKIAQLLGIAQREGRTLVKRANDKGGWTALRTEWSFNLVPSQQVTAGSYASGVCTLTCAAPHGLSVGSQLQVKGATPAAFNGFVTVTYVDPTGTIFSYALPSNQQPPSLAATTTQPVYTFLYPLPSDYMALQAQTVWDANFRWQMLGPLSAQEWGVLQYGISPVGPRIRYQIRNGLVYVNPPPGTAQTDLVGLTYVSSNWCQSAAGISQGLWAQDTDTFRLSEDCFILGLQWRYRKAKGFFYQDVLDDYEKEVSTVIGRDGGARTLPLDAVAEDVSLLSDANVPDTGYGAT